MEDFFRWLTPELTDDDMGLIWRKALVMSFNHADREGWNWVSVTSFEWMKAFKAWSLYCMSFISLPLNVLSHTNTVLQSSTTDAARNPGRSSLGQNSVLDRHWERLEGRWNTTVGDFAMASPSS